MKRREFITLLGGAAVWPLTAQAQAADRRPLVGYLVETTKEAHASRIAPFLEGMRDLGYVQGQNVEIDYRFGDFDRARLPALAEELLRLNPLVIFAADPFLGQRKTPPQVGPERGFQRAVRLRLGTSWTPNRASRPR